jgi:hypothetical protein
MLFGACLMPVNISIHMPAFLVGVGLSGWPATVFFLALGTLDAVIGIGLLRLAPWSRIAAIYFFLFRIANTSLTFLLPENRERYEEGVGVMRAAMGQQSAPRSPIWFGPVVIVSAMAVILWFLIARKEAFHAGREDPAPVP